MGRTFKATAHFKKVTAAAHYIWGPESYYVLSLLFFWYVHPIINLALPPVWLVSTVK